MSLAGVASAEPVDSLRKSTFKLQINNLDPVVVPQDTAVSPAITVGRNGSLVNSLVITAGTSMAPAPFVHATGFVLPVTDPGAAPIKGVQVTAANAAANFAGAPLGGTMPLVGQNKVCLFGPCSAAVANLLVPVSVVGVGGSAQVTAAVNLTVIGAPWTTGTAAIGTITRVGNQKLPASVTVATPEGLATMMEPIAAMSTQPTEMGGHFEYANQAVSLVTPVFVSTNIGASAVVPVWGFLDLIVTSTDFVPEAGTVGILGAIVTLIGMGVSRTRKS